MSIEKVTGRILSDAEAQAKATVDNAERKAEDIIAEALEQAARAREGTEAEVAAKVKSIQDGKIAEARLDGAKALLKEKRRVIDSVYDRAKEELKKLPKAAAVALAKKLLEEYAEEGDEVYFAPDYAYVKEVSALDEVKRKKLKIKPGDAKVDGGFVLHGAAADKDVSFGALIEADKETYQALLASQIFGGSRPE